MTEWNVVANETSVGQYSGAIVTVNGQLAFGIMTEDLDRESGETLSAAMDKATAQLRSALEARSQQRRFPILVRAIGLSILTASLLALGLWLVTRTGRRVLAGMQAHIERLEKTRALAVGRAALGGFDLRPVAYSISCGVTKLAIWLATGGDDLCGADLRLAAAFPTANRGGNSSARSWSICSERSVPVLSVPYRDYLRYL